MKGKSHNMKITRNKIMIFRMVITSISYLIWRIFFTIPFGYGWLSLVFAFFLLTVEILGMIEKIIHFHNMYSIEYPQRPIVSEKDFPHVDVFITTYNEPTYLLYKKSHFLSNNFIALSSILRVFPSITILVKFYIHINFTQ